MSNLMNYIVKNKEIFIGIEDSIKDLESMCTKRKSNNS